VTHGKEKGLTAVADETASPAHCRAPRTNTQGKKNEKKKESKAGWGPPPPGHYHAVAGRWSSVPHASDAATTTTRRPHRSVRRCLTSAAPPGARAAGSLGRRASREGVAAMRPGRGRR
jgi:hypothetical protein